MFMDSISHANTFGKFILNEDYIVSTTIEQGEDDVDEDIPAREPESESASSRSVVENSGYNDGQPAGKSPKSIEPSNLPFNYQLSPYQHNGRENTLVEDLLSLTRPEAARSPARSDFESHRDTIVPNLTFGNYIYRSPGVSKIQYETGLLRHYRYNVAPWIDIGDPESFFGIKLMIVAKGNRALFAAIYSLAACHRSLIEPEKKHVDLENALQYRHEAENGTIDAEDQLGRAGSALLMLGEFFSTSLGQWRAVISHHAGPSIAVTYPQVLKDDLYEPLFSLYFRIGKRTTKQSNF
jgi:hypothetical protein